jgi:hypothetical protein
MSDDGAGTKTEIAAPDLAGRIARCAYHGGRKAQGFYSSSSCKNGRDAAICTCEEPSSKDLAFFEYCGDGSRDASLCRHCGMMPTAHGSDKRTCPSGGLKKHRPGTSYEPQGDTGHDRFYCGCHGWD